MAYSAPPFIRSANSPSGLAVIDIALRSSFYPKNWVFAAAFTWGIRDLLQA